MTNKDKIIHCGLCNSYFHNSGEHTDSRMFKEKELVSQARKELQEKIMKEINDEIKSIIKLNRNKNVTVNHNFWKAHISQLEELKLNLNKLFEETGK